MNLHISSAWLCPQCDYLGDDANQCACGNSHGLLNMASVLNRDPVETEARAVMSTLTEVLDEMEMVCSQ
jgi:hypothetical protein